MSTDVLLFPNPATDYVTVILPQSDATISVVSLDGKTLLQESCKDNMVKLDVSTLKTGIYLIKVVQKNKVLTKKLVINR